MEEIQAMETCSNCNREIPAGNFMIHSVHCTRNIKVCTVCMEPVPQRELQDHHDKFHMLVPCKKCKEMVRGTDMEDHIRDSCAFTEQSCRFCSLEIRRSEFPAHERYCGSRTERCPDCNEYVMLRYRQLHLDTNHSFVRLDEDAPHFSRLQNDYRPKCGQRETQNTPIGSNSFTRRNQPWSGDGSAEHRNQLIGQRILASFPLYYRHMVADGVPTSNAVFPDVLTQQWLQRSWQPRFCQAQGRQQQFRNPVPWQPLTSQPQPRSAPPRQPQPSQPQPKPMQAKDKTSKPKNGVNKNSHWDALHPEVIEMDTSTNDDFIFDPSMFDDAPANNAADNLTPQNTTEQAPVVNSSVASATTTKIPITALQGNGKKILNSSRAAMKKRLAPHPPAAPPAAMPAAPPAAPPTAAPAAPDAAAPQPPDTPEAQALADKREKKARSRCGLCRKRLSIATVHTCRCGGAFCAPHRYAEVHGCAYDYKASALPALRRDNPRVRAPKLPHI